MPPLCFHLVLSSLCLPLLACVHREVLSCKSWAVPALPLPSPLSSELTVRWPKVQITQKEFLRAHWAGLAFQSLPLGARGQLWAVGCSYTGTPAGRGPSTLWDTILHAFSLASLSAHLSSPPCYLCPLFLLPLSHPLRWHCSPWARGLPSCILPCSNVHGTSPGRVVLCQGFGGNKGPSASTLQLTDQGRWWLRSKGR